VYAADDKMHARMEKPE